MKKMLRAVFFDLDGTLGNTLPMCIEAFRRTMMAHGHACVDDEAVTQYFGASDRGVLARCLPGEDVEALMREYMKHYRALHPIMAPAPFPWVHALLSDMKKAGIRLAMVTGKEIESAEVTLDVFGLKSYFERVETGDPRCVVKGERLRDLLRDWQLNPQETLYVGDVPSDVEASHSVGIPIAAAAWAETADPAALAAAHPEYLFTAPEELRKILFNEGF